MRKALKDLDWLSQRLSGLIELGEDVKELEKLLSSSDQLKAQMKAGEADVSKTTFALKRLEDKCLLVRKELEDLDSRAEASRRSAELAEAQYARRVAQAKKEFEALVLTYQGREKELEAKAVAEAKRRNQDLLDQVKVNELKLAAARTKLAQFKETL